MGTKEDIYNTKIVPLLSIVFEICQNHSISFICSFELDKEGEDDVIMNTSVNLIDVSPLHPLARAGMILDPVAMKEEKNRKSMA